MGKKKKLIALFSALVCVVALGVGTTVAYITSFAGSVRNTFTVGDIELTLGETTGATYQLIPGTSVKKDPRVTVGGGSEDCWLFIKVTKTSRFDDYITSAIEDGWTHLGGFDGVYYRHVTKSAGGSEFGILKDNSMTVVDTLTEEKMTAITEMPKITFKAYAVQSHSIDTANDAWHEILKEGME